MRSYARSDLACESCPKEGQTPPGAEVRERESFGCHVHCLTVETEQAACILEKPMGEYITVECGGVTELGIGDRDAVQALCGELLRISTRLLGHTPNGETGVFVAGLGNAELTADALGPLTVAGLTATRHLREHERELYRALGCSALSSLAPGVLGQTGIETLELLRGAVSAVRPELVLVVDSLAARSCDRLSSTVQLTDAGIIPGSGVGNRRSAITAETLGVPVIAIGVPTVVDSATLVYDALQEAGIEEVSPELEAVLENGRSFFVSPKESDVIVAQMAKLVAGAIDLTFVGELQL